MSNIPLRCAKCGKEFEIDEFDAMEREGDLLCPGCEKGISDNELRVKFEYMVRVKPATMAIPDVEVFLNHAGVAGWELVSIFQDGMVVLKRRYVG